MTSTHQVNTLSSSAATGCGSTITIMVITQDAPSEQVVRALLDRTSHLLTHPLAVALYRQGQSSLPLERFLANLLQSDDGEKCLMLPWHVSLSTASLIETAKHALALATHEEVEERSVLPRRHSTSGLASFGSWDGVRNPEDALDRLIALSPGWHRQATWLGAGTRSVLLPCIEQTVPQTSVPIQQLTSMMQAIEGALLHESSITASLRTDGAITTGYLTRLVSDFVMVLTSTSSVK